MLCEQMRPECCKWYRIDPVPGSSHPLSICLCWYWKKCSSYMSCYVRIKTLFQFRRQNARFCCYTPLRYAVECFVDERSFTKTNEKDGLPRSCLLCGANLTNSYNTLKASRCNYVFSDILRVHDMLSMLTAWVCCICRCWPADEMVDKMSKNCALFRTAIDVVIGCGDLATFYLRDICCCDVIQCFWINDFRCHSSSRYLSWAPVCSLMTSAAGRANYSKCYVSIPYSIFLYSIFSNIGWISSYSPIVCDPQRSMRSSCVEDVDLMSTLLEVKGHCYCVDVHM